ncbi:MAG TPA: hypothetical protein VJO15_01690, partial [Dehalococcoidia bacterium]|nr:hypothetical protein [Dehalococcoidia bacterium]
PHIAAQTFDGHPISGQPLAESRCSRRLYACEGAAYAAGVCAGVEPAATCSMEDDQEWLLKTDHSKLIADS